MSLSIDIAPDLQVRLNKEAARSGMDSGAYIARLLEEQLGRNRRSKARLSDRESILLEKVNFGLSAETWLRYHELIAKRQDEMLTTAEQASLVALSDQIEALNAQRLEALAELARLRGVSLPILMTELGIKVPRHA